MFNLDKKTTQFFVVLAYLRYRMNRKCYFHLKKIESIENFIRIDIYEGVMNDSWNHLQELKRYYYGLERGYQVIQKI